MTNSPRPCPECGRPTVRFTRGVCHTQCYKRHVRAGTTDELPNGKTMLSERVTRMVNAYLRMMHDDPSLTQRDIAARLGVAQSTLSEAALSRGIRKARPSQYKRRVEEEYDYA